VQVAADTGGATIHAVEAVLRYDPTALSVEHISTDGSALTSWATTPSYDGAQGSIRFSGWAGAPFSGSAIPLITVTFEPLQATQSIITFDSGDMLATDAQATNVLTSMASGSYTLRPQQILATSAPDSSVATSSSPPPGLTAPTLLPLPDVQAGERIVVQGSAQPNVRVSVSLQHNEDAIATGAVLSAADGSFTYVSDAKATAGVYTAWAMVEGADGHAGPPSAHVSFTVQGDQAAAVITAGIMLFSTLGPYVIGLALLSLGLAYLLYRRTLVS